MPFFTIFLFWKISFIFIFQVTGVLFVIGLLLLLYVKCFYVFLSFNF